MQRQRQINASNYVALCLSRFVVILFRKDICRFQHVAYFEPPNSLNQVLLRHCLKLATIKAIQRL